MLLVIGFIFSTLASLVIAEGKQMFGEVYWSISLSIMFFLAVILNLLRKYTFVLPKKLVALIILSILAFLLSAVFSQSRGYSLSIFIRLISALTIFILFLPLARQKENLTVFAYGLLIIGSIVALLSLLLRFLPEINRLLPPLNLLFSHTGHNQAVYLLIFTLPLSTNFLLQKKSWQTMVIFALHFSAIIFSFARGAWIMAFGYFLFVLIKKTSAIQLKKLFFGLLFTLVICGLSIFAISLLPLSIKEALPLPATYRQQLIKGEFRQDSRFANWRQALRGFADQPLVGTGPGTFYLTSRKYHQTLHDGAALAHNFVLQTLSEQGIIGSLPLFCLLFLLSKKAKKIPRLTEGLFLSAIYSNIEYNLDYLTVWLVFWASLGLLTGLTLSKAKSISSLWLMLPVTLCLVGFASITILGNRLWLQPQTKQIAFRLTAYNANRTERYLEYLKINQPVDVTTDFKLINFFHRTNPSILLALGNLENIFPNHQRESYYLQAIAAEPLNKTYTTQYLRFLLQQERLTDVGKVLNKLISTAFVLKKQKNLSQLDLQNQLFFPAFNQEFVDALRGPASLPESVSKSLYVLGLSAKLNNRDLMLSLWQTAKNLSPDWDLFHLELAAFYKYIRQNEVLAKQVLVDCQKYYYPELSCRQQLENFDQLQLPGAYLKDIKAIPQIVN